MKRSTLIAAVLIMATWFALAEWQRREYFRQRELIRGRLVAQADAILTALVSGVRSHRWIGPFFESQLPGTLEELAKSDGVVAVAVAAAASNGDDGQSQTTSAKSYTAGERNRLDLTLPPGSRWTPDGYIIVHRFTFEGGPTGTGRWPGSVSGQGPPWLDRSDQTGSVPFKAILVMDRRDIDAQLRREAWIRGTLVGAGALLVVLLALSWRATVKLAAARGTARLLEAESRHLAELGEAGAGLAHETRNPLGLIRGWAQRLSDEELPTAEQRQQACAIVEECDRIASRINEFLAFARPVPPQPSPVAIRELVEQLLMLLDPDVTARKLSVDISGTPRGLKVEADAEQLRQAVFNLLQNAIVFAGEGGRIEVDVVPGSQNQWRLEVSDSGPGPSPDIIDSLFKPYFTTRRDGTGLGLAIVRKIATANGWDVGYSTNSSGRPAFWIDRIRTSTDAADIDGD